LFHANGWTDEQKNVTWLIVAFRNFANMFQKRTEIPRKVLIPNPRTAPVRCDTDWGWGLTVANSISFLTN
jgi:hypothetical protein